MLTVILLSVNILTLKAARKQASTMNWELRGQRDEQYLAIKSSSEGYKADTAFYESLRREPTASEQATALIARMDAIMAKLDKFGITKAEPVVEIDQQAMQAFRVMAQNCYSDTMYGEPSYDMGDACDDDFDSEENYIYRSVA